MSKVFSKHCPIPILEALDSSFHVVIHLNSIDHGVVLTSKCESDWGVPSQRHLVEGFPVEVYCSASVLGVSDYVKHVGDFSHSSNLVVEVDFLEEADSFGSVLIDFSDVWEAVVSLLLGGVNICSEHKSSKNIMAGRCSINVNNFTMIVFVRMASLGTDGGKERRDS